MLRSSTISYLLRNDHTRAEVVMASLKSFAPDSSGDVYVINIDSSTLLELATDGYIILSFTFMTAKLTKKGMKYSTELFEEFSVIESMLNL